MTDLFEKYNIPVPRYTSYPTAPHFHDGISHEQAQQWLINLPEEPISLYLHVPFCRQLCFYCGCHMKVVNGNKAIQDYVQTLQQEIQQVAQLIGRQQMVQHIHWGGGTPSVIPQNELKQLMKTLRECFDIQDDAEHAMELDPRVLDESYIDLLAEEGINRASIGVQDFDASVQKAINRVQPFEDVENVVNWLRKNGINNINFDLIYGLPEQNLDTIAQTISLTQKLTPTRIALFGYAHVPWMKKHQKILEKYDLPKAKNRQRLFDFAVQELENAGYMRVGYDHFALPDDSMAIAFKNKMLHRNFQGFTVDSADTLIGLGVSSISCLPAGYIQNYSDISEYRARVENSLLPVCKGVAVTKEDILRRCLIERLMCDYVVDVGKTCQQLGHSLNVLDDIWPKLEALAHDQLVEVSENIVKVTVTGKPFIRVIAACFDAYFEIKEQRHAQAV
ncbi:MAG: oxygen-independent coproporphyrinogen III oxidase [Alphaproteobacteria bacterium]|nr:oxygen-independent coproporphyrinogen III oxidase [Alphaproteobacteria bacterium]